MKSWNRKIMAMVAMLSALTLAACGGIKVVITGGEFGDEGKVFTADEFGMVYIPVSGGEYKICVETEPTCKIVIVPKGSLLQVQQ